MVNRASDDICQIRLDFVTFNIAPPNNTGECLTDFFLVTGGSAVPQICGINDGQHLIYSITSDSGPSQLSMILDTTVTVAASRMWNIRVTQYSCSSRNLAPVGCLQYYTGASGEFKSFNYKSEVSATNDPNHLANQNYAVCIRVENGYCGIRYSQVTNDIYSFTVSGDSAQTNFMLASSEVKYGDTDCRNDYIIIPGGSDNGVNNEFSRDRFCGNALGPCATTTGTMCAAALGPVTTYSKPFIVTVITDEDELNGNDPDDSANRGFRLVYNQRPCLTTNG